MISFARALVILFHKLLQPLSHILQDPGKQIQTRFTHAYNYCLKIPADKLMVVKEIAHILHYSIVLWVQVLPFIDADLPFLNFLRLNFPVSIHTPWFKISWKLV